MAAVGLLLVQVPAAVQAFAVLGHGLGRGSAASVYFAGLLAGTIVSVAASVGTRVLAGNVPEMLAMGRNVLGAELGPAGGAGPLVLVALAIGLGGVGIQQVRRRQATISS